MGHAQQKLLAHFRQPTTVPVLQSITFQFADGLTVEWRPPLEDKHQLPDGTELTVRAQNGMLHLLLGETK